MSSGQEKSTQTIYTGSLLSQETTRYLLCNQNPDYKHTLEKWPWAPQVTHFLWHTNTTKIRTPSDSALTHQYSEIQEIQKGLHLMKIKSKDYSNPIPLLWENPKAWMQILKTQIYFHTFTNVSKLLSNFKRV